MSKLEDSIGIIDKERGPVYDFHEILPDICDEYVESEKSIKQILKERGGPSFATFNRHVKGNSELQEMWIAAEHAKAAFWDSKFDDIYSEADKAFKDKKLNVNALKIKLDIVKTRRGHLHSKFRDREVTHVVEAGESWRTIMTKARARLEGRDKIIEAEVIEQDS